MSTSHRRRVSSSADFSSRLQVLLASAEVPSRPERVEPESIEAPLDPFQQRLKAELNRHGPRPPRVVPERPARPAPDDLRFVIDNWAKLDRKAQQLILTLVRTKLRRNQAADEIQSTE